MKKISILGSTGSIGKQAINILSHYPEAFEIIAISGSTNVEPLLEQAKLLKPKYVVIFNEVAYQDNQHRFEGLTKVLSGMEGLKTIATLEEADIILNAVVGNIGLVPTLSALRAKKHVAVANKECLVTAGEILMAEARKNQVSILPVDSEHSAIFQALQGNDLKKIKRVILTASGGPFRQSSRENIEKALATDALKHPNWSMGRKISIDSATLMNKGLEVIEAKWLYDLSLDQIDVVVHPESIIHSMVEYVDHSIIAQMSRPNMEIPILYALSYPERLPVDFETVDFIKMGHLSFESPRYDDFPCLDLAYESMRQGGLVPTVLNAANEELVYAYLEDRIGFYDIPKWIEKAMQHFGRQNLNSIDDILKIDTQTRQYINRELRR